MRRLGTDGRLDPTHATLAADTSCSDRTVRRATAAMRDVGLLRWQTRLVRASWRAEQTSNAYELVPTLAAPPVFPRARCGGHNGRETLKEDIIPYCCHCHHRLRPQQRKRPWPSIVPLWSKSC